MKVRVSYGTAIAMGLVRAKMMARPTTAYLMTYWPGRCRNDCAFCAQARSSNADWERLSRITWPPFELEEVLEALPGGGFSRICFQTVDYPGLVEDVITLLSELKSVDLPVSLSITPVEDDALREFRRLGVDYVGIGLDVASERLFAELKPGLYSWGEMWDFTERVLDTFGRGRAFVHLIAGLGETDRELVEAMERAYSMGADVSLFAFTPIKGTALEYRKPPSLARYRRLQIARHLLEKGYSTETFIFDGDELVGFDFSPEELLEIVPPSVFATHGCPACNRPYYNERPRKEPYNFPFSPDKKYLEEYITRLSGSR